MTDEERDQMLMDLHNAFLQVPAGSPKGAEPLLTRVRTLVIAYERASWVGRWAVWVLAAIAGVLASWETIRTKLPW